MKQRIAWHVAHAKACACRPIPRTVVAAMREPGTRKPAVTFAVVRRVALKFPGVEEGSSYGTAGFRVRGRFLARLKEDGESLVVKCGFEERDFRMLANPGTFYITDHYRGYPTVLVRLASVTVEEFRAVFEQAWRLNAPKRLIALLDRRR